MLTRLTLKNIVLIRTAILDFGSGLTVLSGETGAGKSILLDALGLIIGNRAEARLVRSGEEQAQLSAEFSITDGRIRTWLHQQDIECEDQLIIRRIVKADGTSKAYMNDAPVTLKTLKQCGEKLVEIHGQHGQKGLLDAVNHGYYLDSYAGNGALLADVHIAYKNWNTVRKDIKRITSELEQAQREQDYMQHMLKELDALSPEPHEETQLVEQRTQLMQAEKTGAVLQEVSQLLNGATPIAQLISKCQNALIRSPAGQHKQGQTIIDGLERCLNELADAEMTLEAMRRDDGYDEQALEKTENRLFALRDAARKHRTTVDGLHDIWVQTQQKMTQLRSADDTLRSLHEQEMSLRTAYQQVATLLSHARADAAEALQIAVHQELAPLKMEATRFKVICTTEPQENWRSDGMDTVHFEVSTNAGSPFGALSDIASGGELSRFMLALAVVLGAKNTHPPMMIFDEIDTGTGGAVADAIGARLKALARGGQVCVVTHLPQVAARGQSHYFIEKHTIDGQTETRVKLLDASTRHEELARMLSGAHITDEARQAAARLLEVA
jgi:DNA repair protein RecN (Recombination protein N)